LQHKNNFISYGFNEPNIKNGRNYFDFKNISFILLLSIGLFGWWDVLSDGIDGVVSFNSSELYFLIILFELRN